MRDRQVQFLPIQWRASLKLSHSGAEAQEDIEHELHNRFTLDDITLKKSIPYVRELTNSRSHLPRPVGSPAACVR